MQPETAKQEPVPTIVLAEARNEDLVLSRADFDRMMGIIEEPPEVPDYVLGMAAWYNTLTA